MFSRALVTMTVLALGLSCGEDAKDSPDNTASNNPNNPQPNNTQPNNTQPNNTQPNNTQPNNTQPNNTQPNNTQPNNTQTGVGLAARYPGDRGIEGDPAVVWYEGFEHAGVEALANRYDDVKRAGLSLVQDTPAMSPGETSVEMRAGGDAGSASDLFKLLPGDGYDQLYVRYYVKYQDAPYHHSGMWLGGYNPASRWPNPQAGTRPSGNDRVSVAIEPVGNHPQTRRMDFYNYWMGMRGWQAEEPMTSFWGNPKVHSDEFYMRHNQWVCIEFMVKLNSDLGSSAGAELAVWENDQLHQHFTSEGPIGYWIRDKFCPADADSAACTDYAPANREQDVLNLQWRNSSDLKLNWIWPQNYISEGAGSLQFDDMVVATERIGCITL